MLEKFERLVYEFQPEDAAFGLWSHGPQPYLHGEKAIPDSNLTAGFQIIQAPVLMDSEPICHREEETMFFLGASLPDVFLSFDAEIHFYMGKTLDTMEKIVITEPTAVRVPKGYWHGPLNFVRIDKPILFQAAQFSGNPGYIKKVAGNEGKDMLIFVEEESHRYPTEGKVKSVKWTAVNEDGVKLYTDKGAYDHTKAPDWETCALVPGYKQKHYTDATMLKAPKPELSANIAKSVLAMPKEVTDWGSWMPNPKTYLRGETYMEGASYHIGWQIFTEANNMEEPHFHQGKDEYLFFMGSDPMNMFDFDSEIEIFIGDDPDHMESKIITKPTVIRFPPNVWHCPIKFRKMKKPILFQAAFLDGTWGTITRGPEGSGAVQKQYFNRKYTYDYMGDNVRYCKYNDKKRCIICGKCFPRMDNVEKNDK